MAIRRLSKSLCLILVTSSAAAAEPAGPAFTEGAILASTELEAPEGSTPSNTAPSPSGYVPKPPPPKVPVSIGVNLPVRWEGAGSIAGTLAIGLSKEHALRLNVASYENAGSAALVAAALGEEDEGLYSGRTTDVGAGFVHFPRRLWDGFSYEAGVLFRNRNLRTEDSYSTPEIKETDTKMFGGRVMIGWSWLMAEHVFVAFGVGFSMGYERGTETTQAGPYASDQMRITTDVSRPDLNGEGYLRIGGAFDL